MLVYPVASTGRNTGSYVDAADERLDLLSLPASRLGGLPPAVVVTAERDPLRDEGEELAANLHAAGVPVDATRYSGVMHEFFGAAAVMTRAVEAQSQVASAIRGAFSRTHASVG